MKYHYCIYALKKPIKLNLNDEIKQMKIYTNEIKHECKQSMKIYMKGLSREKHGNKIVFNNNVVLLLVHPLC